jgi:hypothetical protein
MLRCTSTIHCLDYARVLVYRNLKYNSHLEFYFAAGGQMLGWGHYAELTVIKRDKRRALSRVVLRMLRELVRNAICLGNGEVLVESETVGVSGELDRMPAGA